MIFEHEIPAGSRLYFAKSAKIKREIESISANLLESLGYSEMVTPLFSYHQHESFDDTKELIRLNDSSNHAVTLRADSTTDVVRIATQRLGRSSSENRWFYIQPVYTYPTNEHYQIGAEVIEGDFAGVCKDAISLLDSLDIEPILQVANIAIPKLLSSKYGISIDDIKSMNLEKMLESGLEWIERLIHIDSISQLDDLSMFPNDIANELSKISDAVKLIEYPNIVISPLYYARLRYYDSLVFRFFEDNTLYMRGGSYSVDRLKAVGFSLHTDACIAKKMQKDS